MQKYDFFIGVDISKKWIDVSLTKDGNKKTMAHCQVDNTESGFKKLLKWMRTTADYVSKKSRWLVCMEHTGVYTLRLCRFLAAKKIAYTLVDPLHLKYSLGLRRGKNDKDDSGQIAYFAFLHREELQVDQFACDNLLIIKNLLSLRRRLQKSKHGLGVASTELKAFDKKATSNEVCRLSERHVKYLNKSIKEIEKQILSIIQADEKLANLFELIVSVKGAQLIIAASLLVYTRAFTAFDSSRKFAVYIGLVPFEWTSGQNVRKNAKVSHLAHKTLKGYISNGASSATRHDKQLKAYYQRRLTEGKDKFIVQNAIRNKFLHRIFAVVKRGTPYVEFDTYRS